MCACQPRGHCLCVCEPTVTTCASQPRGHCVCVCEPTVTTCMSSRGHCVDHPPVPVCVNPRSIRVLVSPKVNVCASLWSLCVYHPPVPMCVCIIPSHSVCLSAVTVCVCVCVCVCVRARVCVCMCHWSLSETPRSQRVAVHTSPLVMPLTLHAPSLGSGSRGSSHVYSVSEAPAEPLQQRSRSQFPT